ncbi:hypothetical protein BJK05_17430 [Pectobacterium polaris]|nr:hypothetical protein BJK05_17430 [Pectobacterium polaris]
MSIAHMSQIDGTTGRRMVGDPKGTGLLTRQRYLKAGIFTHALSMRGAIKSFPSGVEVQKWK